MSNIATLKKDHSEAIFDELRGKRFVAGMFDKETMKFKWFHNDLTSQEIVFLANAMILNEMGMCEVGNEE